MPIIKCLSDSKKKIIIMGAAGRDFHNFNVCFRKNKDYKVVAFTATQIPDIDDKIYPSELSGSLYPNGIPIYPEEKICELIRKHKIDEVILAYSDISHQDVMHKASLILATGANFTLLGARDTMIKSTKPVTAICAVRTGCGKSPVTRKIAMQLKLNGQKVAIIRHPMPYGDLAKQAVQRFETYEDLEKAECTIEEREEYEPIIKADMVVWAGVDYEAILREAEKEADIIIWDGGNNDLPFIKPDTFITIVDPHRVGHETNYYPGETNLRMADTIIINKENTAQKKDIDQLVENITKINPEAKIVHGKTEITVDKPELIKGKICLVIEDGPTVTHGGMAFGAGIVATQKYKAKKIMKPFKWAKGSIKETYKKYPHLENILPAMGYSEKQIKDLEQTINETPCDTVVSATPIALSRLVKINKPIVQVSYEYDGEY